MADERITTESVALSVLETDPIVLRESETRRLVFKPMIVDLPEVVRKILDEPDSELAKALQALDPESLLSLGRSVDLSKLDALLLEWDANEDNDDEGFWQDLLTPTC
jgi:hypothetical protein